MHFLKKAAVYTAVVAAFLLGSTAVSAADIQYHTVKKGDTCYQIARQYGTEVSAVLNANGIGEKDVIYPGRRLTIDANAKNTPNGNYTVKRGDTLHSIATSRGITTTALKQQNGLTADRIYAGQKLKVDQGSNSGTNNSALSNTEIQLMAKMIHAEARGESYRGQVAVGAVIMNRIKSNLFPNTLNGVLYQKNQFSAVNDGQFHNAVPGETALAAAREAASGSDPTYGALYYWNPQKANNSWLNQKPILVTIGNHVFAK
ncbi:MAG: LysM peptidoglycan-binding domain-containing protein [Firmicutes bacterium]|nr:LysM peptidoglycan-binding domain-containing protein [Bacillota bacterium]